VLQDLVHTLTGMMDGNVVQFYNLTAGSNVWDFDRHLDPLKLYQLQGNNLTHEYIL
jgi:hypothetical protein